MTNNKVALVTASTKGIGLATVISLAKQGYKVYMGARNLSLAKEIVDSNKELNIVPIKFDVYKPEGFKIMVDKIIMETGRIDVLVNTFGTSSVEYDLDLIRTSEKIFIDTMKANVMTTYTLCKLVIPHMIETGGGSIVNVSSIGGAVLDTTRIAYGVSKSALNNLTQQIALQYGKHNIRCNAVLPGLTLTKVAIDNLSEEFMNKFTASVPLRRVGQPEDVAETITFLATDKSSYITGSLIEVAGGYGLGIN